jgi:hypothetical protein
VAELAAPTPRTPNLSRRALVMAAVGAAVALTLGVYGRSHTPTREGIFTLWFSGVINLKAWFATAAFVLALFQLLSALRMYGKIRWPRTMPRRLGLIHRGTGTLAFLFSLPVAYHCLWSLGFQTTGPRQIVHGLLGCVFYGAFATKVLFVQSERLPGWALPWAGGTLFAALTGIWLTSSLWFFTTTGFPAF